MPRGSRRKLTRSLRETITCLSSLYQKNTTIGRTLLPSTVSRRQGHRDSQSSKPPIWATYIRWASLCPIAWTLLNDGLLPLEPLPPPIVAECGRKAHDKLLKHVRNIFLNEQRTLANLDPKLTYNVKIGEDWHTIVAVPDLLVLYDLGGEPVNLVIEVTLRGKKYAPIEWLASYAVGAYLENMRPTFVLLVTPEETKILPLTTGLLQKLLNRLKYPPPTREPNLSLCTNCDLRQLCPSPL